VFFADRGIAFHEGNLNSSSAGCVRLSKEDASAFFDFLQPGDPVEVH
jgi:lipoprotein-anchoring transpeptidase ErfK/SrfK